MVQERFYEGVHDLVEFFIQVICCRLLGVIPALALLAEHGIRIEESLFWFALLTPPLTPPARLSPDGVLSLCSFDVHEGDTVYGSSVGY